MPERKRPDRSGAGASEPAVPLASRPARPPARVLRSHELLAGASELTILHGADAYRLRLTSKDKLILTK